MKNNTRKILLALMLVLAIVMSFATVSAFAAEEESSDSNITIYFQNNWMWSQVSVHYWGSASGETTWPGMAMTLVENDGTYDIYSASIPADVTGIVINGIKDDGSGALDQTPDITTGITNGAGWKMNWDNGNLAETYVYSGTGEGGNTGDNTGNTNNGVNFGSYTVAGTAGLCGSEWDVNNTDNDLTADENGIYSITYQNVPAGDHKFKVAADHSWDNAWPGQDYSLSISEEGCSVTISFNPANATVTVKVLNAAGEDVTPENGGNSGGATGDGNTYTVAGVAGLCGSEWNPGDTYNDMTFNAETGLYEKTFTGIPAGDYECKVAANHSWDLAWGGDAGEYGNYAFSIFDEQNVTITFDPATGTVSHTISESTGADENRPSGPSVDIDESKLITVYLSNSANWLTPYAHVWIEGPTDTPLAGWPGVEMLWDSEKLLYYIEIPAAYDSVVFSDNSNPQTADLVIPGNGYIFDNTTNEWTDIKNFVPPVPPENTTEDVTVYVKDDMGWGDVYIYYWDVDGAEAFAWPGTPMEYENGYYTAVIPAGYCNVIFSNGGSWEDGSLIQTPDLRIPTNGKNYISNSAQSDKDWYSAGGNQGGNQGGNDQGGDQGGNDQGGNQPTELTFLQKIAKALLLFLRSVEDFFKGFFKKN